jgi:hypothetical protein
MTEYFEMEAPGFCPRKPSVVPAGLFLELVGSHAGGVCYPSTLLATIILRSFIPLFRIAYFPLQLFGVKMRLIESLAGWVWDFSITHRGCPCHVGDF